MRKLTFALVFVLALAPARAHAQDDGWWGWIERLSGPGKFTGGNAVIGLVCAPEGRTDVKADGTTTVDRGVWQSCFLSRPEVNGSHPELMRVQQVVSLKIGAYTSGDNVRFPDALDENSTKPVHARELGVTYKYKFNEAFEAGFGASWIRFSGEGFSTFDRFLLTPLIVAFRPLATATKEPWGRVVALRLEETYFTQGFTGADFGNTRTAFQTDAELNRRIGIAVDVFALLDSIKAAR